MQHTRAQSSQLPFVAGLLSATIVLYALSLLLMPLTSNAGLVPICTATGNCGVCDLVATFITLGKWLITGAGGLVLLIMVNAAFGFVTSAGNPEKIQASKKQITGGIFGMLVTLAAFQLISVVILIIATPSGLHSYDTAGGTEQLQSGSLSGFLGTPWWSICDQKALRNKYDASPTNGSTANCLYWGDGNACSALEGSNVKMCIGGKCVAGSSDEVKAQLKQLNVDATGIIASPCDYLAAVDQTFEGYSCIDADSCQPGKSESGLCPGANTLCCLPATGGVGGGAVLNDAALSNELQTRIKFEEAGIKIGQNPCTTGSGGKGCTNVSDLTDIVYQKLSEATAVCARSNCIVIFGGTEPGHASHCPGVPVVDLDLYGGDHSADVIQALNAVGITESGNFNQGWTCEKTINGVAKTISNCGDSSNPNNDGWLHVEIGTSVSSTECALPPAV